MDPCLQVVGRIIGPVLTITIFASLVAYAKQNGYGMLQTNSIVPLLSVVVSISIGRLCDHDFTFTCKKTGRSSTGVSVRV